MNGFLPKPVSFKTLKETLDALELPDADGSEPEAQAAKGEPETPQGPQDESALGQGPADADGEADGAAAARAQSLANGPMLADLDKASEMLGGYEELLCEVLEMFLADLPAKRGAVAEALREGDMPALRLVAHSLKSTCGSVGAFAASQAARRVEDLADARVSSGAAPDDGLARAVAELDEVLEQSAQALGDACVERFH